MSYKSDYAELASRLFAMGCHIADSDRIGYCIHNLNDLLSFIYIKPTLHYKQKLMVLAHEAGHLFIMKKKWELEYQNGPRTEKEANMFAVQVLKIFGINSKEYYLFYNETKNKKTRKSWHEL